MRDDRPGSGQQVANRGIRLARALIKERGVSIALHWTPGHIITLFGPESEHVSEEVDSDDKEAEKRVLFLMLFVHLNFSISLIVNKRYLH